MYETPFIESAHFAQDGEATGGGASLRPLEWSALLARIAAAQDLRDFLHANRQAGASSFAGLAQGARHPMKHNEPDVNPVALEAGKGSRAKGDGVVTDAAMSDRGL